MPNGMPNVPQPPRPDYVINMAMQDVNAGVNWLLSPINYGMGWINQGVTWVTSLPGRAISALGPGGM